MPQHPPTADHRQRRSDGERDSVHQLSTVTAVRPEYVPDAGSDTTHPVKRELVKIDDELPTDAGVLFGAISTWDAMTTDERYVALRSFNARLRNRAWREDRWNVDRDDDTAVPTGTCTRRVSLDEMLDNDIRAVVDNAFDRVEFSFGTDRVRDAQKRPSKLNGAFVYDDDEEHVENDDPVERVAKWIVRAMTRVTHTDHTQCECGDATNPRNRDAHVAGLINTATGVDVTDAESESCESWAGRKERKRKRAKKRMEREAEEMREARERFEEQYAN